MKTSFYDDKELEDIGFKRLGDNVLVSRKASIYSSDKIELGDNVRIDDFTLLSGQIKMGNNTHLGTFTGLYGHNGIELEEFVAQV